MAKKASAETVAADMRPPGWRAAISLIRTNFEAKKKKIAGVNGELADMWGKVVGHKVNKVAAKFWQKLDTMEAADRLDVMRSFNGLAANSEWPEVEVDLVDAAQGNIVSMRLGNEAHQQTDDDDDDDDEEVADAGSPADGANDFLGKARSHLRSVPDGREGPKAH